MSQREQVPKCCGFRLLYLRSRPNLVEISAICDDRTEPRAGGPRIMKPSERTPYSAIVDRPPLRLPGGLRLVIWPIVNLEVWEIERPMARQVLPAPTGLPVIPDVPNWSWHEYGMRVGIWRFFAAFDRLGILPTLSINAKVTESNPRVSRAALERRWEFMGHSHVQMPIHAVDDQRALIRRSLDTLEK